jgi:hypothetical protein
MAQPHNIQDHSRSGFSPHGNIEVWPEGSVIRYNVAGPFNEEAIQAFGRTVGALLREWQPQGAFVSLSYWQGSMMATPDAMESYEALLKYARHNFPRELINIWFVPRDLEGRSIMQQSWQRLYDGAGFPLEIFHSEDEALERVRWYLANAASANA